MKVMVSLAIVSLENLPRNKIFGNIFLATSLLGNSLLAIASLETPFWSSLLRIVSSEMVSLDRLYLEIISLEIISLE
jgi:hypothetical protein